MSNGKVTLIGGGGVRTPLVIFGVNESSKHLGIDEMVLYDIDGERAKVMSALGNALIAREGGTLRAWFDHTTGGLKAGGPKNPATALKGFEIAGADRKFVPADARIEGPSIVVSNPAVIAPAYMRYGWADNPDCNLYNGEGLPASPFRSAE